MPGFSGHCFLGAEITESYKNPPRMALGPGGVPRGTKTTLGTPWGHLGTSFVDDLLG